ncbi:MAG: N-6 DNA methylase, partial [Lachnospiraceae bacterium]|nr:N-6 DNA methylase [Lachnospiraceae bacterium]
MIEYKYPSRISGSNKDVNKKFIEQVQRQINGFEIKTGIPSNRVMGVVFDGYYAIYIRKHGEDWDVGMPQEMTVDSHELFLMRLISINFGGKALIAENLVNDFGSASLQSIRAISMLYKKLEDNTEQNKAKLLFEQWQTLYREVCGYSFETKDLKIKNLKKQYELEGDGIHYGHLIFAIQTYFSLLIKILSLNILTYLKGNPFTDKYGFHVEDLKELRNDFIDLEEGSRFRRLGISNFLEGDLFSWYLYLWDEEISIFLRTLIETFSEYDYSIIILESDISRDLLKNLYYELLPSVLRKNLGEFYTPDWLAEFLIEDIESSINVDSVFLDPTCGSGTFLVILIKKIMNQFGDDCLSENLLRMIVNNVRGYDLNPLAVICARANYIIALGGLLSDLETPIEIPVYLCDAMLTILEGYEENEECYIIPTKAEVFMIPKKLVDIKKINDVLDLVNDCIRRGVGKSIFEKLLKTNLPILSDQLSEREHQILLGFYEKMEELNRRNLDGVWANVIKNAFAPVFQKKVDYVIGNPPWIDWQNLPENYRDSIQNYWYDYRVFDHKGQKAQLGSAHDDISVLMTYVIMDHFLKDGGRLAFVINQNLLQASGGGDGFRKFMIKEKIPVSVKSVNDFVDVEPFRSLGVNNKTATIVLKKNEKTQYPIIYKKWHRCGKKTIG